ncbi:hypothetical protein BST86_13010 [Nonlabens agnitus]|uniref:Secretion system C-terminal sorting domain-containing protein n=2 Tax=Nonlabens agnitus TaxID=870484 RepID=A0A2S9WWV6_9FLAO|nr:hypothetical protein BST86_13010 [Nonlabens agnitus]
MFSQGDKSWSKMAASEKSFYELQKEFNNYWSNRIPEKGQGYKIFKRWENQIADKVYPTGDLSLPSNTYPNFIQWQKEYNNELAKDANSQMKATSATSSWTTLNQGTVASGYDAGSGRLNFITFDPLNPTTTMYVGAPDGGLWKTTNGGVSWSTNTDYLSIIGCSGLVIHPSNPNLMYLATGDRESDRRSIGVLKSTDGGANWQTTGLVWTVTDNYRISKIVMDPNDPLVMMVSTDGGVFRTTDGWDTVSSHTLPTKALSDVKYKPGSSTIAYAAGKQIYKSTNGGISWIANTSTGLPNPVDVERIEMAVTPADVNYVYAIIGKSSDQGFEGFYRSTDSGNTFTKQSTASTPNILHSSAHPTADSVGGQAFHDLAIAVSPVDKNKVTIGGVNQWQSTDGGVNWTRITYWLGANPAYPGQNTEPEPYIHADIQYIAYMPGSSTTFFTTCDGGVSKTTDDGVTWTDITNNIAVSQQTNIALSPSSQDFFFAGLQDIGSLKYDAGSWSVLSGGDGEDGFIDHSNDNVLVSSTVNGQFFISMDRGLTSSNLTFTPALPSGDWFTPIKQDPVDADKIYIGSGKDLYVSSNWFTANPTASKTGTTAPAPINENILKFEIAPSSSSTIYVIKDNIISKSINSGSTWSDITNGLPVASAKLKNLAISNTDASKIWVIFSGYAAGEKVYKTTDGGNTWINVSNGLPNIPMNTIVYRKNSPNDEVYIGADIGVYAIDNLTTSAVPFLTDLPKCAVTDLEIFYPTSSTGILRAATYGRGSWQTSLSNQSLLSINDVSNITAPILFPNPINNGVLNVEISNFNNEYTFQVYNLLGEQILTGDLKRSKTEISMNEIGSGMYIIKIMDERNVYTQKIIVE